MTDTPKRQTLVDTLRDLVGRRHVLVGASWTRRYRQGYRFGDGPVLAVVRPGSLVEMWRTLNACAQAGVIVIMQAANTGLTGGSTPDGADYDRDIVMISTMRLAGAHLIDNGRQVVCLPGETLFGLEKMLRTIGRQPHSVIGSSCLGASVLGGVCNNSGGSLIQRGPAFTQQTLFARIADDGRVELVNHLGIDLGGDPETILRRLEAGDFAPDDVVDDPELLCSDHHYREHVRDIEATTPARFNADPRRLYEASGSAGKLMLFAARLDTFPAERQSQSFYIGTNDPAELTELRRHMLAHFRALPVEAEYLHRDAFDIAEAYGKDSFLAIQWLGTDRLPLLFAFKSRLDAFCARFPFLPRDPSDRLLQFAASLFPRHLPERLYAFRDRYEHHLILRMGDDGIEEARDWLTRHFPSANGDFFACTPEEGRKALLHRFAAAGAAVRYRAIHRSEVSDMVALDIALPRNGRDWLETLPGNISEKLAIKLYYGHFFCQVFHQDYLVKKGFDPIAVEHAMWEILDVRGAEYPAEHNVGHLYHAKPALLDHYRALDPINAFNPGIGKSSKRPHWG